MNISATFFFSIGSSLFLTKRGFPWPAYSCSFHIGSLFISSHVVIFTFSPVTTRLLQSFVAQWGNVSSERKRVEVVLLAQLKWKAIKPSFIPVRDPVRPLPNHILVSGHRKKKSKAGSPDKVKRLDAGPVRVKLAWFYGVARGGLAEHRPHLLSLNRSFLI